MIHQRSLLCLFIGILALSLSIDGIHAEEKESRNEMENILPLLFLMGGAPTVFSPAVWMIGMISLGAVFLLGKDYLKLKTD